MVCRQCGRENKGNVGPCIFCGSKLDSAVDEIAVCESPNYESNLGFANANAPYEASLVINRLSETGNHQERKVISEVNSSQSSSLKQSGKKKEAHVGRQSVYSSNKSSKHKEKKLAEQRQQRLYEELRAKLQEDKQGTLNRYMYLGLNQDIEADQEEVSNTKNKNKSILISAVGLTTGFLLAAFLLLYMGRTGEQTDYTFLTRDSIVVSTSHTEEETYVFNAIGDMLYKFDEFLLSYYTPDHTAAILYNMNTRYLAYVNGYRMKEFTTTVYNFALSEDGNYILYSVSGWGDKYYLMLYDVREDKEKLLDLQEKHFDLLNILPGGEMISYVTYKLNEEDMIRNLQSYVIKNSGTPELVGNDLLVLAVSMDRRSLYYTEYYEGKSQSLYVRQDGIDKKLSEGVMGIIFFNKDFTEVLAQEDDNYYLWSSDLMGSKLIEQRVNGLILPKRTVNDIKWNSIVRYGIQSFAGKLFLCNDGSIRYVDDDLQTSVIGQSLGAETVTLSKEGKELFFLDSLNNLVKIRNVQDNNEPELWANGIRDYRVSESMSQVYYIRGANLYFKKNKGEERLICENVHTISSNMEDIVFFLKDYESGMGTLYYSKDGLPAVAVDDGTGVTGLQEWNYGVIYQKVLNNTPVVFYNTKGSEFLFIMDGFDLLEANSIVYR